MSVDEVIDQTEIVLAGTSGVHTLRKLFVLFMTGRGFAKWKIS